MLQRIAEPGAPHGQIVAAPGYSSREQGNDELLTLLQLLRRNIRLIAWAAVLGLFIALGAIATITPLYKATATVLVDPRKLQLLKDREIQRERESLAGAGAENAATDSEVEILKSPALARRVVQKMNLQNDDEFAPGLVSRLVSNVVAPVRKLLSLPARNDGDPLAPYVKALAKQTDVNRQKLTYIIQFDVWSADALKAAKIANTFVQLYLGDQVSEKQNAGREMANWMNSRAAQLRRALASSEDIYERYKAQAGLFDPGGEILSNQQIQQLNEQLIQARAQAAAAEAKYEQVKQITPDKIESAASTPDALQSEVIKQLRSQYADVAKQYADVSSRYGPKHPMLASAKAQMNNLSNQIKSEIGRIVAGAKIDFEMKKSSQQSMEASLEELKEKAVKANEASIKMHELDAEVQASKDVYQAFLSRAKESAAQIEMQTPDSRVIAIATAPADIDFPKRSLVLAMGVVGGMVAGIGFVIARDAFAGGFRRPEELETVFGMHTLARIPMAGPDRRSLPLLRPVQLSSGEQSRELVGLHGKAQRFARVVLDHPDSPFSESIQSLRIALRRAAILHGVRTVLFTSALPDEGKSTVCINLARASATEGVRTLLIDADLRGQSVAAALGLTESCGLADYLTGRRDITISIPRDKDSELFVISSPRRFDSFQALKLLSSQRLADLLAQARDMFDLVLIDAPPLLPVADSRVLIDVVDGAVLVIAAGKTGREALSAALHETPGLDEKLLGVALNKMTADFERYYRRMAG